MARFGSEKIRGHGMPEAIESILTRGSVGDHTQAGIGRFADSGATSALVTDDGDVIGSVTLSGLLKARLHDLTEEHRERVIVFSKTRSTPASPSR
jgi:chloride channel protein, CIC family